MLLKVLHKGVLAYARSPWNLLDLFVVVVSVVDLALASTSLGMLRALRCARALRPLRLVSRNEGMRLTVLCILKSLRPSALFFCAPTSRSTPFGERQGPVPI